MVREFELGDICSISRGQRVTKKDLVIDGIYPVISGGVKPLGYINKYNRESNVITIAQYGTAGYVNMITTQFWANDVCYSIFPNALVDNKYLYYFLKNNQDLLYSLKTDAIPSCLPIDRLKSIKIFVPSLEKQKYIVSILDRFSTLAESMESGIPAEIGANRKRYEYYRDKLLSFDELH